MSKIAAMSLFRDSSQQYIDEYFDRARSISGGHQIDFFLVEGDSKNNTFDMLRAKAGDDKRFKVIKNDTGLPQMGSTVHETRFKCLTRTANPTIADIAELDYDYFWYIDSDLLYSPGIVNALMSAKRDVIAPIIMAGEAFYDIWAYRNMDGKSVGPHTHWIVDSQPIRLSSVGGCVMIKHEFIRRGARMTETESIVGLCEESSRLGAEVWMDTTSVVFHPRPGGGETFQTNLSMYGSPAKAEKSFKFSPTNEIVTGALSVLKMLTEDKVWTRVIENRIRSKEPDIRTVLYGLARSIEPRRYLEIGVRRGHSMAMVAHAYPKCNIVGFDAWIEGYGGVDNPGPDFVTEEMLRVGHTGKLRLVSGKTSNTLKGGAKGKFDLILIDGDHSTSGTISDAEICFRHMSDKCVVVVDDLHNDQIAEAWNAIKHMAPDGWESVKLSDEVGVIKKVQ